MRNILIAICILVGSYAHSMGGPGGQRGQGGPGSGNPPTEAISACESKEVNDQCSMETPRGNMSGTCNMDGEYLACMPEGMGRGDRDSSNSSNTSRYVPQDQRSYID